MVFITHYLSLLFREEEAIKLDGLSVAEMKELQQRSEKHQFQAEVDRMMKLIINSLYKNKEVRFIAFLVNLESCIEMQSSCPSPNFLLVVCEEFYSLYRATNLASFCVNS
jgi:hypothetical protein